MTCLWEDYPIRVRHYAKINAGELTNETLVLRAIRISAAYLVSIERQCKQGRPLTFAREHVGNQFAQSRAMLKSMP